MRTNLNNNIPPHVQRMINYQQRSFPNSPSWRNKGGFPGWFGSFAEPDNTVGSMQLPYRKTFMYGGYPRFQPGGGTPLDYSNQTWMQNTEPLFPAINMPAESTSAQPIDRGFTYDTSYSRPQVEQKIDEQKIQEDLANKEWRKTASPEEIEADDFRKFQEENMLIYGNPTGATGKAQPTASPIDYALLGAGQGLRGMAVEGLSDFAGALHPALGILNPQLLGPKISSADKFSYQMGDPLDKLKIYSKYKPYNTEGITKEANSAFDRITKQLNKEYTDESLLNSYKPLPKELSSFAGLSKSGKGVGEDPTIFRYKLEGDLRRINTLKNSTTTLTKEQLQELDALENHMKNQLKSMQDLDNNLTVQLASLNPIKARQFNIDETVPSKEVFKDMIHYKLQPSMWNKYLLSDEILYPGLEKYGKSNYQWKGPEGYQLSNDALKNRMGGSTSKYQSGGRPNNDFENRYSVDQWYENTKPLFPAVNMPASSTATQPIIHSRSSNTIYGRQGTKQAPGAVAQVNPQIDEAAQAEWAAKQAENEAYNKMSPEKKAAYNEFMAQQAQKQFEEDVKSGRWKPASGRAQPVSSPIDYLAMAPANAVGAGIGLATDFAGEMIFGPSTHESDAALGIAMGGLPIGRMLREGIPAVGAFNKRAGAFRSGKAGNFDSSMYGLDPVRDRWERYGHNVSSEGKLPASIYESNTFKPESLQVDPRSAREFKGAIDDNIDNLGAIARLPGRKIEQKIEPFKKKLFPIKPLKDGDKINFNRIGDESYLGDNIIGNMRESMSTLDRKSLAFRDKRDPRVYMSFNYYPATKELKNSFFKVPTPTDQDGKIILSEAKKLSNITGQFFSKGFEKLPAGTKIAESGLSADSMPMYYKVVAGLNERNNKGSKKMFTGKYKGQVFLNDMGEKGRMAADFKAAHDAFNDAKTGFRLDSDGTRIYTAPDGKTFKDSDAFVNHLRETLLKPKLEKALKTLNKSITRMEDAGVVPKGSQKAVINIKYPEETTFPLYSFKKHFKLGGKLPY